jgi:hypothetical protein
MNVDDFLKLELDMSLMHNTMCFNVSHVNFFFLLLDLLVSPDQMKDLEAIDEVVNLSHKAFHENDFRQANAQIAKLRGKSLKFTEIVKLHG